MSFDIFLSDVGGGGGTGFPREIVARAFGPFIDKVDTLPKIQVLPDVEPADEERWVLRFADGGGCDVYIDVENPTGGFMVSRPAASPAFWEALIEIMKQTDSVLYWPNGGAVVAKESTIAQMPPSMIEVLGTPKVTTDVKEIHAFISATA